MKVRRVDKHPPQQQHQHQHQQEKEKEKDEDIEDTGIVVEDSSSKQKGASFDLATPATTSMESDDDFMSDASSPDFLDTQGSDVESVDGMSSLVSFFFSFFSFLFSSFLFFFLGEGASCLGC